MQIVREGHQLVLIHPHPERQQTANGLLYQGRKIRGDESYRKVLAQGDVFRIGDEQGALVTLSYQDGSGKEQEALPPMRPIRLGEAELTIGRQTREYDCAAAPPGIVATCAAGARGRHLSHP